MHRVRLRGRRGRPGGESAVSTADFALTAGGGEPPRASQVARAAEGGVAGDREGRPTVARLRNTEPGTTGTFRSIDAFGFSMGSLTSRGIMCAPGREGGQPVLVGPPIRALVTMGGPHHGGLQRVARWAEELIRRFVFGSYGSQLFTPREAIRWWSPGTADLLDYESIEDNPTLFRMNELFEICAPTRRIGMVGGTDSGELPPGLPDAIAEPLSGRDFVGELPNDSVVALRSAHAEEPPGPDGEPGPTVRGLANKVAAETEQDFNHFDVGKRPDDPQVDPTRAQPISEFIQTDILPHLSDWAVVEERVPFEFEAPTPTDPGSIRYGVDVHFNAQSGEIGAVGLVFYGRDAGGNWHILAGAAPETREALLVEPVNGNSRASEPVRFPVREVVVSRVDPEDPATNIVEADALVVKLPDLSATVPPDPTNSRFQIPGVSP